MELTNEQITQINELAKLAFTEHEIAIMLQIDPIDFALACSVVGSVEHKAFYGGLLESELIFRRKLTNLASLGSAPAQKMLKQIMEERDLKRFMHDGN